MANANDSREPQRLTYKEAARICRENGWNLDTIQQFAEAWSSSESTEGAPLDYGWQKSVTVFGHYGLNGDDFQEFVMSIERKGEEFPDEHKWRYFCGCAWNTIKIIKDIAENGGIDK